MDVTPPTAPISEKPVATLTVKAASITALPLLGFVCYAGPYVTGLVYRGTYLGGLNVPTGLFKSDASDYFVYAYLAVLETFKNWLSFISSPAVWTAMIGIIALFTAELLLLPKLLDSAAAKSVGSKLGRNKYVAVSAGVTAFAAAITTVVLLIPPVLLPFLILPGIVGKYGAQEALKRDLALYGKGCGQEGMEMKDQCHVLIDGPRVVAVGFLITSSSDHIALYKDGKTTTLPIKDYTITTVSPKEYEVLMGTPPAPVTSQDN